MICIFNWKDPITLEEAFVFIIHAFLKEKESERERDGNLKPKGL